MSAKTGVAPVRATELAVAAKVNDGTMTSSPGPDAAASSPRWRPEVPELTATHARPSPKCSANSFSKAFDLGTLRDHAAAQHPVDRGALLVADDRLCGWDEVATGRSRSRLRMRCRLRGLAVSLVRSSGQVHSPARTPPGDVRRVRPNRSGAPGRRRPAHGRGRRGSRRIPRRPSPTADRDGRHAHARAPIEAPSPIVTPTGSQSEAVSERAVEDRPRAEGVVGQHHGGADEHTMAELGRLVDQGIVLDLAVVADAHARTDVSAASDDAVAAEQAPSRTCARCQTLVPSPILAEECTSADGATRVDATTPHGLACDGRSSCEGTESLGSRHPHSAYIRCRAA